MKPESVLRVARPTDRLREISAMYQAGLGFEVLASFEDHEGFDGIIVGHPGQAYHLEFTLHRGHPAELHPEKEHLLVFYFAEASEWAASCQAMEAAGFVAIPSNNPYWDVHGSTFLDLDGYRVVLARND